MGGGRLADVKGEGRGRGGDRGWSRWWLVCARGWAGEAVAVGRAAPPLASRQ